MGHDRLVPARKLVSVVTGATLGLALGVLAPAGCSPDDSAEFNAELASLVCQINARCPDIDLRADWGSVAFEDVTCEGDVEDHFSQCPGVCELDRGAARKCLRRLERVAEDCEPPFSLGPCRRAYKDCATSEDETSCTIHTCSARLGAPPSEGVLYGVLLLLGLVARRRRV